MPADLDEFALAKLAREMAMNIRNYKAVFDDFGIDENDFYQIEKIEFYKRAKEQFTLEWNSALSVNERVKLISAAYAEEGLPTIGRRMLDPQEPFTSVLEAYKSLAKTAGLGDNKAEQKPNDRFIITINLGADTETFNKSIDINPNDMNLTSEQKAITETSNG